MIPGAIVALPETIDVRTAAITLSLDVDPAYAATPRRWSYRRLSGFNCGDYCGGMEVQAATGQLTATANAIPAVYEVTAVLGAQDYTDTVVVRQIPRSFVLACRVYDCEHRDGRFSGVTVGAYNQPLWLSHASWRLLDRSGAEYADRRDSTLRAGATFISRDTSVVAVIDGVLRSRFKDDSVWIIRQQFGYRDSVQFLVRQMVGLSPRMTCPVSPRVGDTLMLSATPRDSAGNDVVRAAVTTTWRGLVFGIGWVPDPTGTVFEWLDDDGTDVALVITQPGRYLIEAVTNTYGDYCDLTVSP